jgi:DNA-binding NarL/FixJ family response regulator
MESLCILIADDYPIVRRGLRALLEAQPGWKIVAESGNGRDAVRKAAQLRPHIALLNVTMPQLNGLDAARLMLKRSPHTRVLVLTMYDTEEVIERALGAGARGYILKSEVEEDLVAAIKAVMHGKIFFSTTASNVLLRCLRRRTAMGTQSVLTLREREIVQLLAEGKSNKQVAGVLGISTRTAENHRANIMKKLGLASLSELVRYAIRDKIVSP